MVIAQRHRPNGLSTDGEHHGHANLPAPFTKGLLWFRAGCLLCGNCATLVLRLHVCLSPRPRGLWWAAGLSICLPVEQFGRGYSQSLGNPQNVVERHVALSALTRAPVIPMD